MIKKKIYAVKKDGRYLGDFSAAIIAKKIGCSLSLINTASRKGSKIKGIYEIREVAEQKEPEQAAVRKRRMMIVGSEKTKKTTSAGRTFKLPIWHEYYEN